MADPPGRAVPWSSDTRLLDDLADMIDAPRPPAAGLPLVLLGHSMGGLVAARLVSLNCGRWMRWCCHRPRWMRA